MADLSIPLPGQAPRFDILTDPQVIIDQIRAISTRIRELMSSDMTSLIARQFSERSGDTVTPETVSNALREAFVSRVFHQGIPSGAPLISLEDLFDRCTLNVQRDYYLLLDPLLGEFEQVMGVPVDEWTWSQGSIDLTQRTDEEPQGQLLGLMALQFISTLVREHPSRIAVLLNKIDWVHFDAIQMENLKMVVRANQRVRAMAREAGIEVYQPSVE